MQYMHSYVHASDIQRVCVFVGCVFVHNRPQANTRMYRISQVNQALIKYYLKIDFL